TGSHVEVARKRQPNALNDGIAARVISTTMAATRRISERAAPRAKPRNNRSPCAAPAVILLSCRQQRLALVGDLPDPRLDLLHDRWREWGVEEVRRVLLAVVDHPPEELHH